MGNNEDKSQSLIVELKQTIEKLEKEIENLKAENDQLRYDLNNKPDLTNHDFQQLIKILQRARELGAFDKLDEMTG